MATDAHEHSAVSHAMEHAYVTAPHAHRPVARWRASNVDTASLPSSSSLRRLRCDDAKRLHCAGQRLFGRPIFCPRVGLLEADVLPRPETLQCVSAARQITLSHTEECPQSVPAAGCQLRRMDASRGTGTEHKVPDFQVPPKGAAGLGFVIVLEQQRAAAGQAIWEGADEPCPRQERCRSSPQGRSAWTWMQIGM